MNTFHGFYFHLDFPRAFLGLHYNKGLKEPARKWDNPPTDCEPDVAVSPRVHERFITHPRPVTTPYPNRAEAQ